MNVHVTRIFGLGGTAALGQERIAEIGRRLGYKELGIFRYPDQVDSARELNSRIDGIIASINYGDVVILQYPTWNSVRFNHNLIGHFKAYHVKLIIFVEDLNSLMWNGVTDNTAIQTDISILNCADLLILPSPKMYEKLKSLGLTVNNVVFQTIWDYPMEEIYTQHSLERKLFFPGGFDRFPFLLNYSGKTPIEMYFRNQLPQETRCNVKWMGQKEQNDLIRDLAKGGIGLVWSNEDYFIQYYSLNQSYKLGTYLAAGIPVVVQKGAAYEDFVTTYGLGIAVKTINEADNWVQNLGDQDYLGLYNNVKNVQYLVTRGHYTRQVLETAVEKVLLFEQFRSSVSME